MGKKYMPPKLCSGKNPSFLLPSLLCLSAKTFNSPYTDALSDRMPVSGLRSANSPQKTGQGAVRYQFFWKVNLFQHVQSAFEMSYRISAMGIGTYHDSYSQFCTGLCNFSAFFLNCQIRLKAEIVDFYQFSAVPGRFTHLFPGQNADLPFPDAL